MLQMKQKLTLLLMLICTLSLWQVKAQSTFAPITPNALLDTVFDRFGNKYNLRDMMVDTTAHTREGIFSKTTQLCSAGYFDLYFENGSGMEGSSTAEIDRRNVICQVFSDISTFINSPLTTNGLNNKVKIWVRDITLVPGFTSGVLGLASSYYNVPYSSTTGGIADNEIWKTIHSGMDSYTNVSSPLISVGGSGSSGFFYHGMMAFNFAQIWNTNLGIPSAPAGNYDLYSVALHEVTHALGFASLINFNGTSKFGTGYNYYARYDLFLQNNPSTSHLITNSGSCSLYNYQFNPVLSTTVVAPGGCISTSGSADNTACTVAAMYVGATNVQLYTPNCFEGPSSLSHFEDQCFINSGTGSPYGNNLYFNMSNANGTGVTFTKRFLKPEERLVLCDLGYNVNTTYGNSVNYNDYNYGGAVCSGLNVSGINDGITSLGSYSFINSSGSNIFISSILSNDINANSFECLEDLTGSSTLSGTSGVTTTTITFNSSLPGAHLLRYIPFSSSTGVRGNITYIYVYVLGGTCTPSACNLLNNGGFESTNTCGQMGDVTSTPSVTTHSDCWTVSANSPDVFERNCTNTYAGFNTLFDIPSSWSTPISDTWNGTPNNFFVGMVSLGNHICEGIQSTLNSPVVQNGSYTISFRAKVSNNSTFGHPPSGTNGMITIGATPNMIVPIYTNMTSLPSAITQLGQFSITNDNSWHNYVQTFTYTPVMSLNNLIVLNSSNMNILSGQPSTYIYVDDISLVPSSQYIGFDLPNSALCTSDNISDLSIYLSPPSSGGIFSGAGVGITTGGTYSLNASSAGIGVHNISYTYTNNIGCQETVVDDILVVNPASISLTVSTMPTIICSGNTATLTASGATTYTWQPGNLTGTTVTITPSSTTVYTITGTVCTGTAQTTKTVVVNPVPTINAIVNTSPICPAQTVSLTASGASTYTWQPVNLTGVTVPVSPTITTIYTVTGTNICGISSSNTVVVSVVIPPTVTITATNSTICAGQTVTLTASGDINYSWWNTGANTSTTSSSPSTTTVYTVAAWGTNICMSTTLFTITVVPVTVAISPSVTTICSGQSTTLTASGYSTYSWNIGPTTNSIVVSPTATTIYTVIGTSPCGTSSNQVTVNVNTTPTVTVNNATICSGTSTILTASGGTLYIWSSGQNTPTISVLPTINTNYTVTGINNTTGCFNTKTVSVTVNATPTLTAVSNPTAICYGNSAILTATGATTYSWSTGSTTNTISVNPTSTTNYTVVGTTSGCMNTKTVTVTVNTTPTVAVSDATICAGASTVLTASGANTYTWSTGPTTATISVSPTVTTIYTVTGRAGHGNTCTDTKTVTVTVNQLPTVTAVANPTSICVGQTATLTAGGANTYMWSTSATTTVTTVTPSLTTVYTVTGTTSFGCISTKTVTVLVGPVTPTLTVNSSSFNICGTNAATMIASGANNYTWTSTGGNAATAIVTPTTPTVYTVTGNNGIGCGASTNTVIVSPTSSLCCSSTTNIIGTSLTSTVNMASGTYATSGTIIDMQGVITFTGNTSFNGYTLRMKANTLLMLGRNVTVSFTNCKLFSCSELWDGILITPPDNTNQSYVNITNSTIEDMYNGIVYDAIDLGSTNEVAPSANVISITGSNLNKNYICVQMRNLVGWTGNLTIPFSVKSSTLASYSSVTSPGSTLKTSSTYTYAYNTWTGGATSSTNTPFVTFPRTYTGIFLNNIYKGYVIIGDSTTTANTNTFDNMDFGIRGAEVGAKVHNNYFKNITGSTKQTANGETWPASGPDEIGIAVVMTHTNAGLYDLTVGSHTVLPSSGNPYPKGNVFEDCNRCVYANNCITVFVKANQFNPATATTATTSIAPGFGVDAYYYYKNQGAVWVSGLAGGANLSYNYIRNFNKALYSSHTLPASTTGFNISNNDIAAPSSTGYCLIGIQIAQVGGTNLAAGTLSITNNAIANVYNGIQAGGIPAGLNIYNNAVSIESMTKALATSSITPRYAIKITSSPNNWIRGNSVTNNGAVPTTSTTANYLTGIYVKTSASSKIECNTAYHLGRDFVFESTCTNSSWKVNTMQDSYRGLEMYLSAVISQQGGAGSPNLSANTWTTITQETFANGTNPNTLSKLFLLGGTGTQPTLNFGTNAYSTVAGGLVPTTGTSYTCNSGNAQRLVNSNGGGKNSGGSNNGGSSMRTTGSDKDSLTEFTNLVTANEESYEVFAVEMMFQNRQYVYKLIEQDSINPVNGSTLDAFYNSNQNSAIDKLTEAEIAIANFDVNAAIAANSSAPVSSEVEQKYQRANELTLKFMNDRNYQFTVAEKAELNSMANECTVKGAYVAQSRNLVDVFTHINAQYDDNCDAQSNASRKAKVTGTSSQTAFNLFPNPNNGTMQLEYDLAGANNAVMNIFDVTGKLIKSYKLENTKGTLQMNEHALHNGIYFYHILVGEKIIKNDKIIIIK